MRTCLVTSCNSKAHALLEYWLRCLQTLVPLKWVNTVCRRLNATCPPPPRSQRGLRDILLVTGPGKVGALLVDGDWLLISATPARGAILITGVTGAGCSEPLHMPPHFRRPVSPGDSIFACTWGHMCIWDLAYAAWPCRQPRRIQRTPQVFAEKRRRKWINYSRRASESDRLSKQGREICHYSQIIMCFFFFLH